MSEGPIEAKNYSFKALACRQGRDEDEDEDEDEEDKEDEDADKEDEEDEGHKVSTTSSFMLPLGHRKRRRRAAVRVRHDRIYGSAAKARRHGRVLHSLHASTLKQYSTGAEVPKIFLSQKILLLLRPQDICRYLPHQAPQDLAFDHQYL